VQVAVEKLIRCGYSALPPQDEAIAKLGGKIKEF